MVRCNYLGALGIGLSLLSGAEMSYAGTPSKTTASLKATTPNPSAVTASPKKSEIPSADKPRKPLVRTWLEDRKYGFTMGYAPKKFKSSTSRAALETAQIVYHARQNGKKGKDNRKGEFYKSVFTTGDSRIAVKYYDHGELDLAVGTAKGIIVSSDSDITTPETLDSLVLTTVGTGLNNGKKTKVNLLARGRSIARKAYEKLLAKVAASARDAYKTQLFNYGETIKRLTVDPVAISRKFRGSNILASVDLLSDADFNAAKGDISNPMRMLYTYLVNRGQPSDDGNVSVTLPAGKGLEAVVTAALRKESKKGSKTSLVGADSLSISINKGKRRGLKHLAELALSAREVKGKSKGKSLVHVESAAFFHDHKRVDISRLGLGSLLKLFPYQIVTRAAVVMRDALKKEEEARRKKEEEDKQLLGNVSSILGGN